MPLTKPPLLPDRRPGLSSLATFTNPEAFVSRQLTIDNRSSPTRAAAISRSSPIPSSCCARDARLRLRSPHHRIGNDSNTHRRAEEKECPASRRGATLWRSHNVRARHLPAVVEGEVHIHILGHGPKRLERFQRTRLELHVRRAAQLLFVEVDGRDVLQLLAVPSIHLAKLFVVGSFLAQVGKQRRREVDALQPAVRRLSPIRRLLTS